MTDTIELIWHSERKSDVAFTFNLRLQLIHVMALPYSLSWFEKSEVAKFVDILTRAAPSTDLIDAYVTEYIKNRRT
jgi:hypothetical protein